MAKKQQISRNKTHFKSHTAKIMMLGIVFLMAISMVSAMDIDNVIDYKNKDMTVEITNWLGLFGWLGIDDKIGEATLESHETPNTTLYISDGDQIAMWYEFDFVDIYKNGLGDIIITDMNTGKPKEKDYKYMVGEIVGYDEIYSLNESDYKSKDTGNGTYDSFGSYISKTKPIYEWTPLNSKDIPKGKVIIGVKIDNLKVGEELDIIWEITGKKVSKHAPVSVYDISVEGFAEASGGNNEGGALFEPNKEILLQEVVFETRAECERALLRYQNGTLIDHQPIVDYNATFNVVLHDDQEYIISCNGSDIDKVRNNTECDDAPNRTNINWKHGYWNDGPDSCGGNVNEYSWLVNVVGIRSLALVDNAPTVILENPANDSSTANNYQRLNCSAVDDYAMMNLTLVLDDAVENTITNSTGEDVDLNMSYLATGLSYGMHNWSCYGYDNASQQGSSSTTWVFNVTAQAPTMVLLSPIDLYNSTSTSIMLNCSGVDDTAMLNVTLSLDGVVNETFYNSTGSQTVMNVTKNMTGLADGDYNWTCDGYDNLNLLGSVSERFFTVDTTSPIIDTSNNITDIGTFSLPVNSSWNYTVTDLHLDRCYYNTTENTTYTFITCEAQVDDVAWASAGTKWIRYCVNDTFGYETCNSTSLYITSYTDNWFHNPDTQGEQGVIDFELWVNASATIPITTSYLYFNGTIFNPSNTVNYTNRTYFNYSYTVPNGYGNSTGIEYDYYWNYSISGVIDNRSTTEDNFTIIAVEFDNCTALGTEILNLSLKNEENNTLVSLNGTTSIIELELLLALGSSIWTYNNTWNNQHNVAVCVPNGLLNNTNYTTNFTIGFQTTDHVWEFFYLDDGTISNNTERIDARTNKTIDLMDLVTADSTSFLFNYYDEDGRPVDNSIIHVMRKFIGEGIFREVERAKQDENGDTTVHLVEEDVIYYFLVTNNGELLYTSSSYTALCQEVPCTIQLEASGDMMEFDDSDEWDLLPNGSYDITQNDVIREVNLSYTLDSSGTMNMTIYEYEDDGTYSAVTSGSDTGTSGVISVTVPTSVGNKTFFATIYHDGDFIRSAWVDMEEDAGIYFGNALSVFLGFLIILTLVLMAVTEGGVVIIWLIAGLVLTSALGLIDFRTPTGAGLIIYFICSGGILLWKLAKKNR